MKLKLSNLFSAMACISVCSTFSFAQEICIVTADFDTGTKYIVYWEQPTDLTGLDSVVVFRKQGFDNVFSQVGAVEIGTGEQTFYEDLNANTIITTKYAIAFKFNNGTVSTLSLWHQPIVNDYFGNGLWEWTAYEKEDQVDPSYITGYTCYLDMGAGLGFQAIGSVGNEQLFWTDSNFPSHTTGVYVIEAGLPSCEYETKAEINTSRSNIKQQISNAEASISEHSNVAFTITPNPTSEQMFLEFKDAQSAKVWIVAANGTKVFESSNSSLKMNIDVSNFEAGVYLINVSTGKKITTRKFIKN